MAIPNERGAYEQRVDGYAIGTSDTIYVRYRRANTDSAYDTGERERENKTRQEVTLHVLIAVQSYHGNDNERLLFYAGTAGYC